MGLFKKREDGKEVPDNPYVAPTGGALGGDCNHAGATSESGRDQSKGTKNMSCGRCGANWTENI